MAKTKKRPDPKPVSDGRARVQVECIAKDCWTSGGFLAVGDNAYLSEDAARDLVERKKVKRL